MRSDYEPIIFNTPDVFSSIEVYVIHDLHMGNALFQEKQWEAMKAEILEKPNRYCVFVGDAMENAVPGSKGDLFEQRYTPQEQKEWITEQFTELAGRIIAVIDGNHERNRTTKLCGLYPLYDCCVMAGIKDRYRPHFAFADIGVGTRSRDPQQQVRYFMYLIHKAKDTRAYSSCDFVSGIDVMCCGHDHDPKDHPRARLVYNPINKVVSKKSVEVLDSGSWLEYGGYAADNAYRPSSDKKYKLILFGGEKKIQTVGFYV